MSKNDKSIPLPPSIAREFAAEQTPRATGRRVRLVRDYLGWDQKKCARLAHIRQPVFSNYETGKHMLPPAVALAFCNDPECQMKTGLTLDYLYRDDTQLLRSKFIEWLSKKP